MKTESNRRVWRWTAVALAAAGCLLLGGCLEQCVVWSPDGERAAVILDHGLRLCGKDGKLTEVLVPNVNRVAWFGDSQQLVLARTHAEKTWAPLAQALGAERAAAFAAKSDAAWQRLRAGATWAQIGASFDEKELRLVRIYLRERQGEALRAKLGAGDWASCEQQTIDVCELVAARCEGTTIVPGAPLYAGLGELKDIRVAPGDGAVAFTVEGLLGRRDALQLMVMLANTPGPATLVADRVAVSPDWTPDGRALVYLQASGAPVGKDDLLLGVLVRRGVLEAAGKIKLDAEPQPLAGAIFDDGSRVRCLKDGRVVFNAAELSLPVAAEDYGGQRQQLFALDPTRQSTLVRLIPRKCEEDLPGMLNFFEVSPDERQVLIGSFRGGVSVLTLATGELQNIQSDGPKKQGIQGAPVWRRDGTVTYTRRTGGTGGAKPARAVEVVVRDGGKEQVLSVGWPDELVNRLFSEDQK